MAHSITPPSLLSFLGKFLLRLGGPVSPFGGRLSYSNLFLFGFLEVSMEKETLELMRFIDDGVSLDVSVSPTEQTVWLTQEQMAKLFERSRSIITRHLRRIFESQDFDEASNVRKTNFANSDKPVALYDLDVIISVGYRVNSKRGIQFRRWATSVLKEFLLMGYAISDNRVLIKDESDCSLAQKVEEVGDKVTAIHGQPFSPQETLKEAPT
jgi:hypothetical protein